MPLEGESSSSTIVVPFNWESASSESTNTPNTLGSKEATVLESKLQIIKATFASRRKHRDQANYAIFVDAQNASPTTFPLVHDHIKSLRPQSLPSIKRIYGDADLLSTKLEQDNTIEYTNWSRIAADNGFHCPYHYPRRNIDSLMVMDIMEALYTQPHIQTYILLTSDGDFAPLVHKLREAGKIVIGYGHEKSTSLALSSACHSYVHIEVLTTMDQERKEAPEALESNHEGASSVPCNDGVIPSCLLQELAAETAPSLSAFNRNKLSRRIRQAIDQSPIKTNGWLQLSVLTDKTQMAGELINYKSYGYEKLSGLILDMDDEIEMKTEVYNNFIRIRRTNVGTPDVPTAAKDVAIETLAMSKLSTDEEALSEPLSRAYPDIPPGTMTDPETAQSLSASDRKKISRRIRQIVDQRPFQMNGWLHISVLTDKQQFTGEFIDYKSYGYKKISDLILDMDDKIEIKKVLPNQCYIRMKER